MKKQSKLILGLIVTLIISACSSDDNSTTPVPTPTPTPTPTPLPPPANFATFQPADVVIGQANFTSSGERQGGTVPDANTLMQPYGNTIVSNNSLFISDTVDNRLLIFNTIPTANNTTANFALGQSDLTSNLRGITATRFVNTTTGAIVGNQLFLVSEIGNRILIWNNVPTTGGLISANVVVGQTNFTSSQVNCSATGLNAPKSISVTNSKIVVADTNNHRVMIWNTIPSTNNKSADIVLGQANFTGCLKNTGASIPTASSLNSPSGVWTDGTRLVVLDTRNNRVLIWNAIPITNNKPADLVLGQSDFANNVQNDNNQDGVADTAPTARTLFLPNFGVYSDGSQLYVSDTKNNRILIWDSFPTSSFQPADRVLGQSDFVHATANDDNQDGTPDTTSSQRTLNTPVGVYQHGKHLIITDRGNNRVLIHSKK